MSETKVLTSDEIVDKSGDILQEIQKDESLTKVEIVMLLDTAKMMQVQQITLTMAKNNHDSR